MSFQAYIDNVQAKTGKTPKDFARLAKVKGLAQHGELVRWLKKDFELGHGHATAIAGVIRKGDAPPASVDEKFDAIFAGGKAGWQEPCGKLIERARRFGPDVAMNVGKTYISLLKGDKKFAILQPSAAARLDVGIKCKSLKTAGRLEAAGSWNAMVTHRVRIAKAQELDAEVIGWLKQAYSKA